MSRVLIIAEAGVNHNGSLELAKKLVDAAADAGADVIKFQTFNPKMLTSEFAPMAEYQKKNTGKDESQLEMLEKLTLSRDDHHELINYCQQKNIQFCSSPFDSESIDFLKELNLPFWKIPSGEITNYPYLKQIAEYNEPVIMSTGMSTMADIDLAISVLTENGLDREKITLLHCNTQYPTMREDVNLNCIKTIRDAFQLPVGYSDHTEGIEFPVAATALGSVVIEKHITLDKQMDGPDHKASLDPDELKQMVTAIRNIEIGMGSAIKQPTKSESQNQSIARKSIVASCPIQKGETFSEENLACKRPGTGISPMQWEKIIGVIANRNFEKDECIEFC